MRAGLLRQWGASDPELVAESPTSRIFRVRLAGGTAMVKDLLPIGGEDELRGAGVLKWRDGVGYVRLLARDGATLLMEDAGAYSLLDHLGEHGDASATAIAAAALATMHAPIAPPAPPDLLPLADGFVSLFAQARAAADPLIVEGAEVASALLADQRDLRPLHGDFHHENLLLSDRGWLAIDGKGLIGDPAYDVANLFYNPLDRDDLRLDPDRIRAMAAVLGPAVGRQPETVLRWAFAHACLSASWHLEDGNQEKAARSLRVAHAVRSVLREYG
jgi:streptomycin 6-kinase